MGVAAVLKALRSDRSLQTALGLVVGLGMVCLFRGLTLIGAEYRSVWEQQHRQQAELQHEAVCRQLGKAPDAPDHARCLDLLDELRAWHEHALAERYAGLF